MHACICCSYAVSVIGGGGSLTGDHAVLGGFIAVVCVGAVVASGALLSALLVARAYRCACAGVSRPGLVITAW